MDGSTTTSGVDFAPAIQSAVDQVTGLLTDNLLVILAVPIAWAGFRFVKKLIKSIG